MTLPAVTSIGVTLTPVAVAGVVQLTLMTPLAASVVATTFVGVPVGWTDTVIRWVVVPAPFTAETTITYVPAATPDATLNVPDVGELVTKLKPVGIGDDVPPDVRYDALDESPSLAVMDNEPPALWSMLIDVALVIVGRSCVTFKVYVNEPLPLFTLSTTFTVMVYPTGAKVAPDVTLITPLDETDNADEPPVFVKTRCAPARVSSVETDDVNVPD
ncbi:MAG: hypothetical protein KGL79_04380 [Acidobacteriota bacterium]|nr:hypothetical protein [Acidobacteriota bacterium]